MTRPQSRKTNIIAFGDVFIICLCDISRWLVAACQFQSNHILHGCINTISQTYSPTYISELWIFLSDNNVLAMCSIVYNYENKLSHCNKSGVFYFDDDITSFIRVYMCIVCAYQVSFNDQTPKLNLWIYHIGLHSYLSVALYIHYRQKIWNIFCFSDFSHFYGVCMVFLYLIYFPTSRYYFGGS